MRISDDVLECVCFLCVKKEVDGVVSYPPWGTGFFITYGEGKSDRHYLVTAKHVVTAANTYGGLHIRLNRRGADGVDYVPVADEWEIAPDADVALVRLNDILGDGVLSEHPRYLVDTFFGTEEVLKENAVGPGDEVAIAGLFSLHSGESRSYPIVRGGTIAAMPNEPVRVKGADPYPGYLIEARSTRGLSGSPVFVMLESHRLPNGRISEQGRATFLLGLIRAHWDDPAATSTADDNPSAGAGKVNVGIAIVTPIDAVARLVRAERVKRAEAAREAPRQMENVDDRSQAAAKAAESQGSVDA